jgi:hypothetical protein
MSQPAEYFNRLLGEEFVRTKTTSAFIPVFDQRGTRYPLLLLLSEGAVVIHPQMLRTHPVFQTPEKRAELSHRLEAMPVLHARELASMFSLAGLTERPILASFISTLDWILREMNRA